MAKQTINIGTTANDGTGDPLRTAFDKVNDNFTELYSDDAGDVDSVNGQTGVVVLDSDDISEGSTNEYYTEAKVSANTSVVANTAKVTNATHTGEVTGDGVLTIANDVISYAKLGTEFTTSAAIAALDVDFSSAQVFTKTLTAATTLTFSNDEIGMVKDLVITGDFTLTLPTGSTVAGTYDGTVSNLIQIVVTGATTYWYSISQPQ